MRTSAPTATTPSCAGSASSPAHRTCHDIRAGAGLVLAGLVSEGTTYISDGYHLDRGYPGLVDQLRSLGADVSREEDPLLFPLD